MKKKSSFVIATIFFAFLTGCGNKENIKDNVQDFETTETMDVKEASSDDISFPARYENTIENVKFNMDIIVDADLTEEVPVIAKAQMKKVDAGQAFDLLFGNNDTYETYEYEENDEYGKKVKTGTYVSPEETTLSYGPVSSQMTYMKRMLMPYIRSAFVLDDEDERYNADLYSKEKQLTFMDREEAFRTVSDVLTKINTKFEYDYTGYALDYATMQSQEYHEDIDGNIDNAQYKEKWSVSDEGYYFCINEIYRGLPLYHVYCEIFSDIKDANAPVQAFVSQNGIEYLDIEKVFDISEEKIGVQLLPIDAIVETAANKYTQILGSSTYEMTNAELYYYVDLSSGMGVYDVKPVWIMKGIEESGEKQQAIQVIIDAQTAKEIIP
ncbi:hypothetical protein IMSAGC011_02654 [Lachnospiraceae bacterium]|nr:hypothetical protein IMSAGC011_02654 [Lachnospiraceae bacterium]